MGCTTARPFLQRMGLPSPHRTPSRLRKPLRRLAVDSLPMEPAPLSDTLAMMMEDADFLLACGSPRAQCASQG